MGLLTHDELAKHILTFLIETIDSVGFKLLFSCGIDRSIDRSETHCVEVFLNRRFLDILGSMLVSQTIVIEWVLDLHKAVIFIL